MILQIKVHGELQSLHYDITVGTHVHLHNTKMYTVHVPNTIQ